MTSKRPKRRACLPAEFSPAQFRNFPSELPHDIGRIQTPKEMARAVPTGAKPEDIDVATRKAVAALAGSGPRQAVPHLFTASTLGEGIERLRDFALAGDAAAMEALGFLLRRAVADFGEIARLRPDVAKAWGRTQNVVPVLAGKNIGHHKQLAQDMDLFDVGAATPYAVNPPSGGKGIDSTSPANQLAGILCERLALHKAVKSTSGEVWRVMAANLPPLTKRNDASKQWAEAGWALLACSGFSITAGRHPCVTVGRAKIRKDKLTDAFREVASR